MKAGIVSLGMSFHRTWDCEPGNEQIMKERMT